MTITTAYFINELYIPNLAGSTYAELENLAVLTAAITRYEAKFLKLMLGDTLYNSYIAAMALAPTSGIWYDLDKQIYPGSYQSPAARYIYYQYWKTQQTVTVTTGESQAKVENSTLVSMNPKLIFQWNTMVDEVLVIWKFLDDHASDYSWDLYWDVLTETSYNFLQGRHVYNNYTYPSNSNPFTKINQWGI